MTLVAKERESGWAVGDGMLKSFEVCAGAGGQALGLERAGFSHVLLAEQDGVACETLLLNRPSWTVWQGDIRTFTAYENPVVYDVDLLSGGIPSTSYSRAGKQGEVEAPGDLTECVLDIVSEVRPRAVMIENAAELLTGAKFADVRALVHSELGRFGYEVFWRVLDAADFGVSQRRRRSVLVALKPDVARFFQWPVPDAAAPRSVGDVLYESMAALGWREARAWADHATGLAPTIVGGSKQHGGADLGPTRSKRAWARQWVNGEGVGDCVPGPDWVMRIGDGDDDRKGYPKLTVEQVALLQGFPPDWHFAAKKTAHYRLVAQAFPPPVAERVGRSIAAALNRVGPLDDDGSSPPSNDQPTLF